MNVPVIAEQLVDAVRKLSPAADIKAMEAPSGMKQEDTGKVWVMLDAADALKVIDFINDHQAPARINPDQGVLFDQDSVR